MTDTKNAMQANPGVIEPVVDACLAALADQPEDFLAQQFGSQEALVAINEAYQGREVIGDAPQHFFAGSLPGHQAHTNGHCQKRHGSRG